MEAKQVSLTTPHNKWLFSTRGGRLLRWESYDAKEETWRLICKANEAKLPSEDGFNGSILFPWCNRVDGESYMFGGDSEELSVPVKVDRNFHLHGGSVANQVWELISVQDTEIVFKYTLTPSEYYPAAMSCTVRYQVVGLGSNPGPSEDVESLPMSDIPSFFTVDTSMSTRGPTIEGIRVEIEVENLETKKEAWVGLGTHFYFHNPFGGSINEMGLSLLVNGEVQVDEDSLIPDDPFTLIDPIPLDHDFDGIEPRPIGSSEMDTCFEIDVTVAEEEEGAAVAILKKNNFMLEVIPELSPAKPKDRKKMKNQSCIQYLQVYTPPSRDSIAIEPQTSAPNHLQHPYEQEYNNAVLLPKEKMTYGTLFIVTWS